MTTNTILYVILNTFSSNIQGHPCTHLIYTTFYNSLSISFFNFIYKCKYTATHHYDNSENFSSCSVLYFFSHFLFYFMLHTPRALSQQQQTHFFIFTILCCIFAFFLIKNNRKNCLCNSK
jgi:hypothetical protein